MPTPRIARRRYGSFPTTADEGLWASADSPPALFEALGIGLFALMTDLRKVRRTERRTVRATSPDLPGLVVAYLGELLTLQSSDGFVARDATARLTGDPPTAVEVELWGEPLEEGRHARRKEIKAVTWHRLEVTLDPPRARVIVDI